MRHSIDSEEQELKTCGNACSRRVQAYRRMLGIEGRSSIFELLIFFRGVAEGFQSKRFEAQSA